MILIHQAVHVVYASFFITLIIALGVVLYNLVEYICFKFRYVVNYDFPNHIEDYVHRVGRTGRAGYVRLNTCIYSVCIYIPYVYIVQGSLKKADDMTES